jgi:hypothetical protein
MGEEGAPVVLAHELQTKDKVRAMAGSKPRSRTTSSMKSSPLKKIAYLSSLFAHYRTRAKENFGIVNLRLCVEEYRAFLTKYTERDLEKCTAVEVGFGARPFRAAALAASGANICGIDLEAPLVSVSVGKLLRIAQANGMERTVKSVVRKVCFEQGEIDAFNREFALCYLDAIAKVRLTVGNCADPHFWRDVPPTVDFVYSEDVLEHVSVSEIEITCKNIRGSIRPEALLLFRPNMYSGITGGHVPEWYHSAVARGHKKTDPWNHLITGSHEPSVFLNKLSYADYYGLFARYFTIEEVVKTDFGLGRQFLSAEIRSRIASKWTDEDLLTNNVLFVMKNRH